MPSKLLFSTPQVKPVSEISTYGHYRYTAQQPSAYQFLSLLFRSGLVENHSIRNHDEGSYDQEDSGGEVDKRDAQSFTLRSTETFES